VHWGDVNNDGLDDYICIGAEGNMYVSYNRGGNPPTFEHAGKYRDVPAGYSQENVRIADIDGDGRVDYCVTAANGDIHCWRNAGVGDAHHWVDIGTVFTGKGMGDIKGTRFADINGDHRDDWIWMYEDTGKTRIFTNSRGRYFGHVPYWQEAAAAHKGPGGKRDEIKFGRIYGQKGHGADYIRVIPYRVTGPWIYAFDLWQNNGLGGTKMKSDGSRYCDMTGKGRDDELWIWTTGRVQYWSNVNTNGHLSSPWKWGTPVDIFDMDMNGRDRRDVHFADWDGDGKCDILHHSRITGDIEWWSNE
jgi:hypothetical protein